VERIERFVRREGEALARARLAVLRQLGQPIPAEWLASIPVAAYVAAEDFVLQGVDVARVAQRINAFAAAAWAALVREELPRSEAPTLPDVREPALTDR
jgi:hypothetical protein